MKVVLDASAVTAVLRDEDGADVVLKHLRGGLISAVNLAEVFCTSQRRGIPASTIAVTMRQMELQIVPFDDQQALLVADIYLTTTGSSVGFADRACMAAAVHHKLPVLTGDQDWLKHDIGVKVKLFRKKRAA